MVGVFWPSHGLIEPTEGPHSRDGIVIRACGAVDIRPAGRHLWMDAMDHGAEFRERGCYFFLLSDCSRCMPKWYYPKTVFGGLC